MCFNFYSEYYFLHAKCHEASAFMTGREQDAKHLLGVIID